MALNVIVDHKKFYYKIILKFLCFSTSTVAKSIAEFVSHFNQQGTYFLHQEGILTGQSYRQLNFFQFRWIYDWKKWKRHFRT